MVPDGSCAFGYGKRFGACRVYDGVVLQERAGEAVLLAVAFDVAVVGPDGETALTVVIEVGDEFPVSGGTNTGPRHGGYFDEANVTPFEPLKPRLSVSTAGSAVHK